MSRFFVAAMFLFCSLSASASFIGASVSGTLNHGVNPQNDFDPIHGQVPAGPLNNAGTTVTIASPAIEFGYLSQDGSVNADFDANSLKITVFFNAISPLHFSFTSSAFVGQTLSEVSDGLPNGGMNGLLVGDTLTIDWAGSPGGAAQTQSVIFSFAAAGSGPAGAPLPMAVWPGLAMGAVIVRKTRRA